MARKRPPAACRRRDGGGGHAEAATDAKVLTADAVRDERERLAEAATTHSAAASPAEPTPTRQSVIAAAAEAIGSRAKQTQTQTQTQTRTRTRTRAGPSSAEAKEGSSEAWHQAMDAIAADMQPRPPPPSPPLPPSPPPLPPSPPPYPPPPHHPVAPRPPAGFDPLVTLPGIDPEPGPLRAPPPANPWTAPPVIEPEHGRGEARETMKTKPTAKEPTDAANAEAAKVRADDEHLAVVSAFWEVHDARWRSETREKDAAYYRRGLDKLVRLAARAGHSMVVYTAKDTNDCLSLERAYSEGSTSAPAASDPANAPRFACVKLPKENLHYEDWHLADHSLVKNMPCSEKMRDTKLIWLNKINLVESAGHLLQLDGGAKPTKLEWIDADQYSELDVGEDAKEKAPSGTLGAEEGENADAARKTLTLDEVSQWNAVPSASTPPTRPRFPASAPPRSIGGIPRVPRRWRARSASRGRRRRPNARRGRNPRRGLR